MDININIALSVALKETSVSPKRKDWTYHCLVRGRYIGVIGCKAIERCQHCAQKLSWKNVM